MGVARRAPFARTILAMALLGRWVANGIADPIEYARIGREYAGEALYPILVQTALRGLVILILSITSWHGAGSGAEARRRLRPGRLLAYVLTVQASLVVLMEWSERLSLGAPYEGAFSGGVLESGFVIELVLAVGSAILACALVVGTHRLVRALLGAPAERTVGHPARRWVPIEPPLRPLAALTGAGGVRAPPRC